MKIKQLLSKNFLLYPVFILLITVSLTACQSNTLTAEEMAIQNAADAEVAAILFDHELDNRASYNVHKDGSVVIKFAPSVKSQAYTAVVETLRAREAIKSVYAEQGGRQVCPLKAIR